jgi:hypothetical protein
MIPLWYSSTIRLVKDKPNPNLFFACKTWFKDGLNWFLVIPLVFYTNSHLILILGN